MNDKIFEGSTLQEALDKAAAEFDVEPSSLQHEVQEAAQDFWGGGESVVTIRAWVEAVSAPDDAEPEPVVLTPEEPEESAAESAEAEAAADSDVRASSASSDSAQAAEASDSEIVAAGAAAASAAPSAAESSTEASQAEGSAAIDWEFPAPGADVESGDSIASDREATVSEDDAVGEGEEKGLADSAGPTPNASVAQPDGATEELETQVSALLETIFKSMEFDCQAATQSEGDLLQVAITGEDNQYLIEGRGRGLAAIELILNHAFRHHPAQGRAKIRVDAGDFRSQREDEIRDLAFQVSHQAKQTERPQQTRPLNSYERRIVHLTLADDPQVSTRSEGTGFLKAVSVIPIDSGRGPRR